MGERVQCPHCKGQGAWYESDHQDTWLRCLCGLRKLVATKLESITIEHVDPEETVALPRRGSNLYNCLAILIGLQRASTGEITLQLNQRRLGRVVFVNDDVASQLTVLRYKGLVDVSEERKGVRGGSIWEPTEIAFTLFYGLRERA